jgi:quercetin dioxygenase-like cupin family protein
VLTWLAWHAFVFVTFSCATLLQRKATKISSVKMKCYAQKLPVCQEKLPAMSTKKMMLPATIEELDGSICF